MHHAFINVVYRSALDVHVNMTNRPVTGGSLENIAVSHLSKESR